MFCSGRTSCARTDIDDRRRSRCATFAWIGEGPVDTPTCIRRNVWVSFEMVPGLEDFMRASGTDSTRDIWTSRGGRLACSKVAPRRERDDRCLSLRRSFSFAPIDPGSVWSPFSSVSGLFYLAVGTICESPRTGSRTSRSRNDHHRCATITWLHDRLRLIVARRCWFRSGTDRNMPTYATNEHTAKWEKGNMKRYKFTLFNTNETGTIFCYKHA